MISYTLFTIFFFPVSSETREAMQPWNRSSRELVNLHPWRLLKAQLHKSTTGQFSVGDGSILS